ncbi:MAG: hypothetical protein LBQ75_05305, partial [Zoogloeaceae bacterium]|nr:hypothetical protein [Zoogloeaceae bacterium]
MTLLEAAFASSADLTIAQVNPRPQGRDNAHFTGRNFAMTTVQDVLKLMKDNEVKFVDFRFT